MLQEAVLLQKLYLFSSSVYNHKKRCFSFCEKKVLNKISTHLNCLNVKQNLLFFFWSVNFVHRILDWSPTNLFWTRLKKKCAPTRDMIFGQNAKTKWKENTKHGVSSLSVLKSVFLKCFLKVFLFFICWTL